jgi:hypothetical protein
MKMILLATVLSVFLHFAAGSYAQERSSPASGSPARSEAPTALSDQETKFKALLTDAFLAGRWAPLKDGQLGEETGGDKYNIVSAVKGNGDNWVVSAKMNYHDQEFVLPIPVQVKFAGDTAIMVVDKLSIPNGGTYSARIMFHERTYCGTWSGARGGGMLYGVITNSVNGEEKTSNSPKEQK